MGDDVINNDNGRPKKIVPPAGIPVDSGGNQTIDPTKNVLDLVTAAVKRLDDLFTQNTQRQDELRSALDKRVTELNSQRDAFDIRLQSQRDSYDIRMEALKSAHNMQMENVKSDFGKQIAQMLAQQTEKNANLLATALAAVTERLAVVEKNQYVAGGQLAVRDPAISEALNSIQSTLSSLSRSGSTGEGAKAGQEKMMAYIVSGFVIGGVVVGILGLILKIAH